MPATTKARDLGAFINTTKRKLGGTTINRFKEAIHDIIKIAKLPRPKHVIARMIATKAYPKAFYGTETTQPRIDDMKAITTATANAVTGRKQTQRAPDAAAAMAGTGKTDAGTHLLIRRWRLLRRMWHARPAWREQILLICGMPGPSKRIATKA